MNRFETGTKNAEIFKTTAPYNNYSQGSAPRWLFVCSAGLLRSPTGAALANESDLIIEFERQIDWVRAFGGKTSY